MFGLAASVQAESTASVGEASLRAVAQAGPPTLLTAAAIATVVCAILWLRGSRRSPRAWVPATFGLAALTFTTHIGRSLRTPPDFLHQNGHGPMWANSTLCEPGTYGPGYFEVFAWLTTAAPAQASESIFAAQAALSALGPALAWCIARCVGASAPISTALALLILIEPTLARIAQSESYFATGSFLLLWATALLALGARDTDWKSPLRWIGALGAACIIAQGARIHPTLWVPSALVPLVLLGGQGTLSQRCVRSAAAAALIGAVVAAVSLPLMLNITGGETGARWLPSFFERLPQDRPYGAVLVSGAGVVLILLGAPKRAEGAVAAAAWALVALTVGFSHIIGAVNPIIVWAYPMLFLGPAVAAAALASKALRRPRLRSWAAAGLLTTAAAGCAVVRSDELLERPTDVLEQRFLLGVAPDLPAEAVVAYLSRHGKRIFVAPLYGECDGRAPTGLPWSAQKLQTIKEPPYITHWYHSSLCASPEGAAVCAKFEARLNMTETHAITLPARESMKSLGYDGSEVRVALHRLEGLK